MLRCVGSCHVVLFVRWRVFVICCVVLLCAAMRPFVRVPVRTCFVALLLNVFRRDAAPNSQASIGGLVLELNSAGLGLRHDRNVGLPACSVAVAAHCTSRTLISTRKCRVAIMLRETW